MTAEQHAKVWRKMARRYYERAMECRVGRISLIEKHNDAIRVARAYEAAAKEEQEKRR